MTAPRCLHLRAKGLYIPEFAPEAFEDGQPAGCWCNRTFRETGPDGEPVAPFICDSTRPCYEPAAA